MQQSQSQQPNQGNPMGYAPVNPMLLKLSIPMMISMLVQALYNVVDSVFVSRVSENALSAVSLAFPLQSLLISFAVGTAVGVNALLSKSLGERNQKEVDRSAMNGLFLALCTCAVFVFIGFAFTRIYFASQTADPEIRQYGYDYLSVICIFSLGCFAQCMLEKLLTATGKSVYAMITQLTGAVVNIIFDPIFIFGYFGFPRMEARGAAVATVLGQFVGAILALIFNLCLNKEVNFSLKGFRPYKKTIARIYSVGAASIAMQAIGSIMTFCMNKILIGFTSTAVAVFGVYFKLQSFVFMPVFGLNNGMVPMVSFNYGARKPERILKTIKLSAGYAIGIMVLGFLAAELFPATLLGIFNASEEMIRLGVLALRIISISFLLAGFNIISSTVFQALGHGVLALWVSVGRQLVVLIPVAFLLSLSGNVNLVWWSFPIAELIAFAMCVVFLRRTFDAVIKPMQAEQKAD